MFYSELNQILLREKPGYLVNLKYDRFAQINFPEKKVSLLVISDFKDFEITNLPNSIRINVTEDNVLKTSYDVSYDVNINDIEVDGHVVFNTSKGNIMVICKELSEKVHIDGLMILSNKNTVLDLVTYFSVDSDIVINIPFPESEFNFLTTFINKVGAIITDIKTGVVMGTDVNGNTSSSVGITVSVKYNLVHELEKLEKVAEENKQLTERTLQKLREIKNSDRVISDQELTDLLEEYRELSNESKFWFVETEFTDEDYMEEYSKLCDDLRRDFHRDGKIEFLYDPSVRNAISDRNCELR